MKIYLYRSAQSQFDNLGEGDVIRSDLYRREGDIQIRERYMKQGPWGEQVKYKVLFTGTGRFGEIFATDITTVV